MVYVATRFAFALEADESICDRIVRCCTLALADGPMGQHQRSDFYADFIACNAEPDLQHARTLAIVKTSCALFVRAVRAWCGAPPGHGYKIGSGMFSSLGGVTLTAPQFIAATATNSPKPGDYFYIHTEGKNDDHTGFFIEETEPGVWKTAEGGGGDGTLCKFGSRTLANGRFKNEPRALRGWFDCERVGLPASPCSSADG